MPFVVLARSVLHKFRGDNPSRTTDSVGVAKNE